MAEPTEPIAGLHHVTAIVANAQQTVDFYSNLLGLRLVKQTVNFDDPGTYHLYFGDAQGSPGSILTFFPWQGIRRGVAGRGMIGAIGLAVPEAALPYWTERLATAGVRASDPAPRFGRQMVAFADPSGLQLELVGEPGLEEQAAWQGGPVPAAHAIRRVAGVTLTLGQPAETATLLTDVLGFAQVATDAESDAADGRRSLYRSADGTTLVELVSRPELPYGYMGAGTVHHVAWRTPTDAAQSAWLHRLQRAGVDATPVRDRQYFRSIYFREPGGVLFEIATDPPGFAADEAPDELGTRLMLPPWLEPQRDAIARTLPPLVLPQTPAEGR